MDIVVYCGSRKGRKEVYEQAAYALGLWMAQQGHRLVYGGGKVGLMGAIADGVSQGQGQALRIIPHFLLKIEGHHPDLTTLEIVDSMSERKNRMIEEGDVAIALPGGIGTLEEIVEVISWIKVGQLWQKALFYNVANYYQPLRQFFQHMVEEGFLDRDAFERIRFVDRFEDLQAILMDEARLMRA